MLRILTLIISGSLFISGVALAANKELPVSPQPSVPEVNAKKEIRLDEKPVPLFAQEQGPISSVKAIDAEEKMTKPKSTLSAKKMALNESATREESPSKKDSITKNDTVTKNERAVIATKNESSTKETIIEHLGDASRNSNSATEPTKAVESQPTKKVAEKGMEKISEKNSEQTSKIKSGALKTAKAKDENAQGNIKEGTKIEDKNKTENAVDNTQDNQNPNQDQANAGPDFKVLEFVLAKQVVQREPTEVVEAFAEGSDKGFAFARLNVKTSSEVTFVWFRNNHVYTQYTTPIQAAKTWRTYSSIKLKPGDWKVQLLGKNKEVLAEKTFTIK